MIWPELAKNWRVNPLDSGPPPGGKYPTFAAAVWGHGLYRGGGTGAPTGGGGLPRRRHPAVVTGLLGIPWQTRGKLYTLNCSITRMRWQPGGDVIIDALNDACHLGEDTKARWKAESEK